MAAEVEYLAVWGDEFVPTDAGAKIWGTLAGDCGPGLTWGIVPGEPDDAICFTRTDEHGSYVVTRDFVADECRVGPVMHDGWARPIWLAAEALNVTATTPEHESTFTYVVRPTETVPTVPIKEFTPLHMLKAKNGYLGRDPRLCVWLDRNGGGHVKFCADFPSESSAGDGYGDVREMVTFAPFVEEEVSLSSTTWTVKVLSDSPWRIEVNGSALEAGDGGVFNLP